MLELRQSLASYAHKSWAGWMVYLFSKCTRNADGSVTIPKESVDRWIRQMNTDYRDLPTSEQKSDNDEADKIIGIVKKCGKLKS